LLTRCLCDVHLAERLQGGELEGYIEVLVL
jgi:hypothetical protein